MGAPAGRRPAVLAATAALAAGQFTNPKSPAIPADITIEAVSNCTAQPDNLWQNSFQDTGSTVTANADGSVTYDPNVWKNGAYACSQCVRKKQQDIFLRLDDAGLPPIRAGLQYRFRAEFKGERPGGTFPGLRGGTRVLLWDPDWASKYTQDTIRPSDETLLSTYPQYFKLILDANTTTDKGQGWTEHAVTWTAAFDFKPGGNVWFYFMLQEAVGQNEELWHVRGACIDQIQETRPPADPPTHYAERFQFMRPPQPSNAELKRQSACPWDALPAAADTWENLRGTKTGTWSLPRNTVVVAGSGSFADKPYGVITIPAGSELVFRDEPVNWNVHGIVVHGKLRIGSPTCRVEGPIKITFWGARSDPDSTLDGYGTKGLVASGAGAELDLFGRRYFPTWCWLARTARALDDRAYLQEEVNWLPGQEVVLTTTTWDDSEYAHPHQNEVMTVKAVQGKIVQFSEPLRYTHWAGAEYQGEIGLLTRSIMLEGEQDPEGFGGHLLVATGARGRIAGVASRYMGQYNVLARYPFHLHMLGENVDSYFSDNVVRDSYFRCYVVHGTWDALVTENIAYNAFGSCYYLEDGVEERNTISYNLGAHVKTIGEPGRGGQQSGEKFTQDAAVDWMDGGKKRVQPVDAGASPFYFANCHNHIIGNAASGGWAGFSFPGVPEPIGEYRGDKTVEPMARPMLEWSGNSAHSTGETWSSGAGVYIGGLISYNSKGLLQYDTGRWDRDTRLEKAPLGPNDVETEVFMRFNNTRVAMAEQGIVSWGQRIEVVGGEIADVKRALTVFGDAWVDSMLVTGLTDNPVMGDSLRLGSYDGFQFYGTNVQSIWSNTEFRNYVGKVCVRGDAPGEVLTQLNDCGVTGHPDHHYSRVWQANYHADHWKPQQISCVTNISYRNVPLENVISFKIVDSGSSRMFNFMDWDGSATLSGVPTIMGSAENWWQVCEDCKWQPQWSMWSCPKRPAGVYEREVAHIGMKTPDITVDDGGVHEQKSCMPPSRDQYIWASCNRGYVAQWGHGPDFGDAKRSTIITANEGITGITGNDWFVWFGGGSPKHITLQPRQVANNVSLLWATNYPAGTKFTITTDRKGAAKYAFTFTEAASVDEVDSDFQKYHFDGTTLYLKLKLPHSLDLLVEKPDTYLERSGARIFNREEQYEISIVADCPANAKGWCRDKPQEKIPARRLPCPTEPPSTAPSAPPSSPPSVPPTTAPAGGPSASPAAPSGAPSAAPAAPSAAPTRGPRAAPSAAPSAPPQGAPSAAPSAPPQGAPSAAPSAPPRVPPGAPSAAPSAAPQGAPSAAPSAAPRGVPSAAPSAPPRVAPGSPSAAPSAEPQAAPSAAPRAPPASPSAGPSAAPQARPSAAPSAPPQGPSAPPSAAPRVPPGNPSKAPQVRPTSTPSAAPSAAPLGAPSAPPSGAPGAAAPPPSLSPSAPPSTAPSASPRTPPTAAPSGSPRAAPTAGPDTTAPSAAPSVPPTISPRIQGTPSRSPASSAPSAAPSAGPSASPSAAPRAAPSRSPAAAPSAAPATGGPSAQPTPPPTISPRVPGTPTAAPATALPSATPSAAPVPPSAAPSAEPSAPPVVALRPSAAPRRRAAAETPSAAPSAPPAPQRGTGAASAVPAAPRAGPPSGAPAPRGGPPATAGPERAAAPSSSPSDSPTAGPTEPPSGAPPRECAPDGSSCGAGQWCAGQQLPLTGFRCVCELPTVGYGTNGPAKECAPAGERLARRFAAFKMRARWATVEGSVANWERKMVRTVMRIYRNVGRRPLVALTFVCPLDSMGLKPEQGTALAQRCVAPAAASQQRRAEGAAQSSAELAELGPTEGVFVELSIADIGAAVVQGDLDILRADLQLGQQGQGQMAARSNADHGQMLIVEPLPLQIDEQKRSVFLDSTPLHGPGGDHDAAAVGSWAEARTAEQRRSAATGDDAPGEDDGSGTPWWAVAAGAGCLLLSLAALFAVRQSRRSRDRITFGQFASIVGQKGEDSSVQMQEFRQFTDPGATASATLGPRNASAVCTPTHKAPGASYSASRDSPSGTGLLGGTYSHAAAREDPQTCRI